MSGKWVAVGGNRVYRPWNKWAQGDVLTGVFREEYKDNFGHPGFVIQVDSTDFSDENANIEEGQMFGANHAGAFSNKMSKIAPGSFIQVTYQEKSILERGAYKGKPCHFIDVAIDPSRSEAISPSVAPEEEVDVDF